jgi:hypothetical protein
MSTSKMKGNMPKKAKRVTTKKEAADIGELGHFARHLGILLEQRSITAQDFAAKCRTAGLEVEEYAVRAWLRGENMPKAIILRKLGKVLGLDDPRHILPE